MTLNEVYVNHNGKTVHLPRLTNQFPVPQSRVLPWIRSRELCWNKHLLQIMAFASRSPHRLSITVAAVAAFVLRSCISHPIALFSVENRVS